MKWQKFGLLFKSQDHAVSMECADYARSPQVIGFDDFVRVYFSTARRDASGKYLSYVHYADFDLSFSKLLKVSEHQVISLGKLGCFDEHGIFPFHVFKDEDAIKAYPTGWSRRSSVSAEVGIGYALSNDRGESFKKLGDGPILAPSIKEPFLVGDGFVRKYEGLYYMWYIFGTKWLEPQGGGEPERVYKIAVATSNDGLEWNRDSKTIITDVIGEDECQALPTVIKLGLRWHMVFCYRSAFNFRQGESGSYRLGYAYSDDLVHWHRDDSLLGLELSERGWDSEMMCYPHLFENESGVYLLYNGNDFGKQGFGVAKLLEV